MLKAIGSTILIFYFMVFNTSTVFCSPASNPYTGTFEEDNSTITLDSLTGNYIFEWDRAGERIQAIYEPPNKINPKVTAAITINPSIQRYVYHYSLFNGLESAQKLQEFSVKYESPVMNPTSPDVGWVSSSYHYKPYWNWSDLADQRFGIVPGDSISGFSLESTGLPGIVDCSFEGYTKIMHFIYEPPGIIDDMHSAIYRDTSKSAITGFTVGPTALPQQFIPLDFINNIILINSRSFELGWITDAGTTQQIETRLTTARQSIENQMNQNAKDELTTLLNELETFNGNEITSETYGLLKYNILYMQDNLPAGNSSPPPNEQPTAITLASFTGYSKDKTVVIEWVTESEIDTAGFNILRREPKNDFDLPLNRSLIPSKGSSVSKSSYQFIDKRVPQTFAYEYRLEEVDVHSKKTLYGPIKITETSKHETIPEIITDTSSVTPGDMTSPSSQSETGSEKEEAGTVCFIGIVE